MSKNIVIEGWLTKSPPTKRIWRTKWRRRWFALRQSGDLPGQYFLDYYADRNCRRLKGTINLDLCEQVDAGLHMERAGNGSVDPKLRGSVFTIQTQSRTYHLEADSEEDMEKWVEAICRVCGLRSAEDAEEEIRPYQRAPGSVSPDEDCVGPYIPISECITGVRAQGRRATFTFDQKTLVLTAPRRRYPASQYTSQPHMRLHHAEVSENESNLSEDDSNQSIRNWSVTRSFTRAPDNRNGISEDGPPVPPRPPKSLSLAFGRDHLSSSGRDNISYIGRENMTYTPRDNFCGVKFQEVVEVHDQQPRRRWSRPAPPSPVPAAPATALAAPKLSPGVAQRVAQRVAQQEAQRVAQKEAQRETQELVQGANPGSARPRAPPASLPENGDASTPPASLHYHNLPSAAVASSPPAVDRALKPRHSHSMGLINHLIGQPATDDDDDEKPPPLGPKPVKPATTSANNEVKPANGYKPAKSLQLSYSDVKAKTDALQYLDLDLPSSTPSQPKHENLNAVEVFNERRAAGDGDESAYRTVDFLKTEAFNITRADAEASRSGQY